MTDKLLGHGYYAIALQTTIDGVNGCGDREAAFGLIHKSITRLAGEVSSSKKST